MTFAVNVFVQNHFYHISGEWVIMPYRSRFISQFHEKTPFNIDGSFILLRNPSIRIFIPIYSTYILVINFARALKHSLKYIFWIWFGVYLFLLFCYLTFIAALLTNLLWNVIISIAVETLPFFFRCLGLKRHTILKQSILIFRMFYSHFRLFSYNWMPKGPYDNFKCLLLLSIIMLIHLNS